MAGRPRDERTAERFLVDVDGEKLRAQALLALVDAAPGAIDELGPDRGLPLICARLLRAMDCTTAVLSLVDFGRDTLESVVGYDVSGVRTAVRGSRTLAVDAVAARVIGNREPLFAAPDPDPTQSPGPAAPFEGGWLALPLVLHGESVGMIELLAGHRERRYTTAELVLAQGVCAIVTQAVADSQAFAKYLPPTGPAGGGDNGGRAGRGAGPHAAERTLVDIARRLAEGLEVQHCDVLIRMESSGAVKVVARYRADGDQSDLPGEQSYGLGDVGARARAAASRRIASAHDDDLALPAEERAEMVARGQRAVLYVPIVAGDQVVGFLCAIERRHSRRFTRADEAFATQLAGEAGVAVESARVIDRLDSQNREQRLMLETGAAIASSVDLRTTLSTIAERLVQTLGVAWSDVYDYHAASGELEVIAYYQVAGVPSDPSWLGRRFSAESWPEGLATVRLRRPHTKYYDYSRLSFEDFASMATWGEKATLSVPLVCGNEVFGVLDVAESRYPRRFTADEVRLAEAIGTQAALAIRNVRAFDEAERRNADLATLLGVAATLTSAVDSGTVLAAIARHLREALRSTSAEVYQYDTARRSLELVARDSDEPNASEGAGIYSLSDDALLAGCIDERRVVAVQAGDPARTAQAAAGRTARAGDATAARRCAGSELWVPLVYQDEVLGLLASCDAAPDRCYSQEEIGLATAIAAQAAAALQSARAYERLEQERAALTRLNTRLSAFVELSGQMRGLLSEERLIDLLGRVLHETLEFNQWVIYLFDPDERLFNVVRAFGGTPEIDAHYAATPIPARVMEGLIGSARTISQSHFVDHLLHTWTDEENYFMPGEELVGERPEGEWNQFDSLFVPMLGQKGQMIGYIEAYDPLDRQRPNDDVVRLIEVFASKAASNIELQRAYGELEQQSRTDGLTGLYNHRFFQERLAAEVARGQRFEKPLTLLMIDVDNFKEYNDAFGHPQGDRLLKSLADLLLAQTRTNVDFVARYGGEEFVVLLLETGVGDAAVAAERLQDLVEGRRPGIEVAEAIRAATQAQTFDTPGGAAGGVTVSVGVATFPDHASTGDQLVANADKALYLAKRLGKNRSCVYHQ
jgi:diguanylate cyclase (GGDEF)-like protein